MSKINPQIKSSSKMVDERLADGEGMKVAKQSNIELLRRVTLANLLWENNAYVDDESVSQEIERLIPLCTPEEVYNLALETRQKQKLRHTPLFIAAEMCKHEGTKKYVRDLLPRIITRADMLTDFLALYWRNGKCPLAAQAKKGLADSFHNFNEYHFAKYDRNGIIKLRDVIFLTHPTPRSKEEVILFEKIANRTLAAPKTWEVMLSTGKDKKETWTKLIEENKIGGLAMLRNISNMMKANVAKKVITQGLENLKSSMLLPLDFLKASNLNHQFEREIEEAMLSSYENLPKLKGRTLFIVDVSGSMMASISSKSMFNRLSCACAVAMLAANQCEDFELVCTAEDDYLRKHKSKHIKYPKKGFGIISQIKDTYSKLSEGGIFTRQCLDWCYDNVGTEFDRIIIFSDSQDCDTDKRLPKPYGKYNYICDVSAEKHGIDYHGIWDAEISGWSEHFMTFIASYEGLNNVFEQSI